MRTSSYILGLVITLASLDSAAADALTQTKSCPEYFRFVDFGLSDGADGLLRGGTVFRARESGDLILEEVETTCLNVASTFNDGHNFTIPVVGKINYSTGRVAANLVRLSVRRVSNNAAVLAEENAKAHREAVNQISAKKETGSNFLCVSIGHENGPAKSSCELVNPFDASIPLVVYCEGSACSTPVMGVDRDLIVDAQWSVSTGASLSARGTETSDMIAIIHDFITSKMSR